MLQEYEPLTGREWMVLTTGETMDLDVPYARNNSDVLWASREGESVAESKAYWQFFPTIQSKYGSPTKSASNTHPAVLPDTAMTDPYVRVAHLSRFAFSVRYDRLY